MSSACVREPERCIPVVDDVDVAVAGAGVAGLMAAIAAARQGATTMLIDRFETLGGNMVPGGWCAGGLGLTGLDPENIPPDMRIWIAMDCSHLTEEILATVRTKGVPGEFACRLQQMDRDLGPRHNLGDMSNRICHLAFQMAREAGVRLMLSTCAAGPILEEQYIVRGLIVENKSGRQAIRAKVTIDATGDASVAARTGAPLMEGNWQPSAGISWGIAGIDDDKFNRFFHDREKVPEGFDRWIDEVAIKDIGYCAGRLGAHVNRFRPIADLVQKAWESGEYKFVGHIGEIGRLAIVFPSGPGKAPKGGMAWGRTDIEGKIDTLNAEHVTLMNRDARIYMFETLRFFRKHLPGFENAYLVSLGAYIGARGGRSIESEYVITGDDMVRVERFDDVIYQYVDKRYNKQGDLCDIPYRLLLPKRVEGLLATGRSAHRKPPNLRGRIGLMMMGQASGVAAALAAREDIFPRALDVRKLQKALIEMGARVADPERIRQLLGADVVEEEPHAAAVQDLGQF